jgi:hypothetical protein
MSPYAPHASDAAGLEDDSVTSRLLMGLRVPPSSSDYSCNESAGRQPVVVVLSSGESGIEGVNGFNGITDATIAKCGGSSANVGGFKPYDSSSSIRDSGSSRDYHLTANKKKNKKDRKKDTNSSSEDVVIDQRRRVLMSKLDAISQNVDDVKNVCGEIFD